MVDAISSDRLDNSQSECTPWTDPSSSPTRSKSKMDEAFVKELSKLQARMDEQQMLFDSELAPAESTDSDHTETNKISNSDDEDSDTSSSTSDNEKKKKKRKKHKKVVVEKKQKRKTARAYDTDTQESYAMKDLLAQVLAAAPRLTTSSANRGTSSDPVTSEPRPLPSTNSTASTMSPSAMEIAQNVVQLLRQEQRAVEDEKGPSRPGSKIAFRRVDQVYDRKIHNYKLKETVQVDAQQDSEWDQVSCTFTWDISILLDLTFSKVPTGVVQSVSLDICKSGRQPPAISGRARDLAILIYSEVISSTIAQLTDY